jgi:hypothetical protein
MGVLEWGNAPRAEPYEQWAAYQADSAPPGTYMPNMDDDWKARWKAVMAGQRSGPLRVEVRKTTSITRGSSVQVLLIAYEDGDVELSMNGRAGFSAQDFARLHVAVAEARQAMASWREAHPGATRGGQA